MSHEIPEIIERYSTGVVKRLRMYGVEFNTDDWVLCHISFAESNPTHWCIASSFRFYERRDGTIDANSFQAHLWNPTWEGAMDFHPIHKLELFKPIRVIEEASQQIPWSLPK